MWGLENGSIGGNSPSSPWWHYLCLQFIREDAYSTENSRGNGKRTSLLDEFRGSTMPAPSFLLCDMTSGLLI